MNFRWNVILVAVACSFLGACRNFREPDLSKVADELRPMFDGLEAAHMDKGHQPITIDGIVTTNSEWAGSISNNVKELDGYVLYLWNDEGLYAFFSTSRYPTYPTAITLDVFNGERAFASTNNFYAHVMISSDPKTYPPEVERVICSSDTFMPSETYRPPFDPKRIAFQSHGHRWGRWRPWTGELFIAWDWVTSSNFPLTQVSGALSGLVNDIPVGSTFGMDYRKAGNHDEPHRDR